VLSMRPLTSQFQADLEARKLHSSYDDLVEKAPVRCFRCWSGGDDGDFYVIPDGRACQPYKLLSGEEPRWAYPLPESPNQAEDLVREVDPGAVDQRRFGEKTFEVTHYVALHLRIRARNIDFTYDELPPEPVVVEALRPLFASSAVEVSSIEYEYGEVESDEDEVEE
ncbi:MAG TPA: hypothetical protein VFA10_27260, partial [Ktedonobacteraceae bacterium]|nr:hypothetical protein [Ktedonobacteraceae bacterium]